MNFTYSFSYTQDRGAKNISFEQNFLIHCNDGSAEKDVEYLHLIDSLITSKYFEKHFCQKKFYERVTTKSQSSINFKPSKLKM